MESMSISHKKRKKRKKKIKRLRLFRSVINFIIIIVLAFTSSVIFRNHLYGNDKYIFGLRSFITMSDDMSPVIQKGSLLITQRINTDTIQEGDIITYFNGSEVQTERVIEITNNNGARTFITKGDANEGVNSKQASSDDIIGRFVYSISYAGSALLAVRNPLIMSLCVTGIFVIIFAADAINKRNRKRIRRKKRQKTQHVQNEISLPENKWITKQMDLNNMDFSFLRISNSPKTLTDYYLRT